jgi:small GTP-binding protein
MSAVESVKVVLLGESGVGKSSLALRFVTDEFRPYSEATIGASFMSKSATIPAVSPLKEDSTSNDSNENNNVSETNSQSAQERHIGFKIWDTAGQEKYRSLAPMYYRGSSAAILVYDITKPGSFAALQDWANELASNGPKDLVLAVCGNKSDLELDRLVGRSTGEEYANSIGALYVETSAKEGEGVEQIFLEVAKRVPPPINSGDEYLEEDMGLDLGKSSEHSRSCC